MKASVVHQTGPPEVLKYEDVPLPQLSDGQVLVKLNVIGVNYTDTYLRSGFRPAKLPAIPGSEGSGVVSAVGPGVTGVKEGDPVVYVGGSACYAEFAAVPAERLVPLPPGIDEGVATTCMMQGMTAHTLTHDTWYIDGTKTVLVHAAAGGVGSLVVQMAKEMGARVIATASTDEKTAVAKQLGADETINYSREDFQQRVLEMTDGRGVDVVYDSVGPATFMKSMGSLAKRGLLVSYGQAGGEPPPFTIGDLRAKSLYVTRAGMNDGISTREDLLRKVAEIFGMVRSGRLKVMIHRRYPLSQAADAHRALESRGTIGKLLLTP